MGKRNRTGIPGLPFSWKHAVGIYAAKQRAPRKIGIPLTRSCSQREVSWTIVCGTPALTLLCAIVSLSSSAEPVPAKWLREGKLISEKFNFSVETPGPDSRWTYTRLTDSTGGNKATEFIVEVSADTRFGVIVFDKAGVVNGINSKQFVEGMRDSMPKDWQLVDAKIEPSTFPLKNSSRIRIIMRLPNDSTLYTYGYLVVNGTLSYLLLDYSTETSEPAQFNRFAGSFAILKPP